MSKFICSVCGYTHEGNEAPKRCPVCKSPSSQFALQDIVEKDEVHNNEAVVNVKNNLETGEPKQEKVKDQNSGIDISEDVSNKNSIQKDDSCSEEDVNEILKFGAATLQAVKWYQEKHKCGLKEAKDIVDSIFANNQKQFANNIENKIDYSSEEKSNGLSSIQKFVFGVLIVFLLFVIFGSLSDGMLLAAFVSSCFLAIIICLLLGKIDKKYAWISIIAAIIIPLLSVGLSADNQEQKESGTEVSSQKEAVEEGQKTDTEQKAETRDINNKTKETNKLSSKEQEIADAGYKKGSMAGYAAAENEEFSNMLDLADQIDGMEDKVNEMIEQMASQQYELEFNAPSNLEEEKLKELYIEHFKKGMDDTMDAMCGLGKKGGNR